MSKHPSRRVPVDVLAAAAAAYQTAAVIPHCTKCLKPCCKLESLVLELSWKQTRTLWRIEEARPAFDQRLAAGGGPEEIRAGNGLYYIHGKACPAYDEAGASCRIYGQAIKPAGCSDFPVYEDGGDIVADLRCEAVDLKALTGQIARAAGPEFRVVESADEEFPFIVALSLKRRTRRRGPG